jgi:Domain of unknown function (DUF4382)
MTREQGCFKSLLLLGLVSLGGGCADQSPNGLGRMELRLVDAPADEVKEIVVTITRVEAHVAGGGWQVLADDTATVDLLKLQGGTYAQLGVVSFPAGKVTQLRLYVKEDGPNFVTTPDGVQHPLTVPSGPQSGIKIKGGFDWSACDVGNVTIDFDGKKSIFVHPKGAGAGDEWLLRPVVRLKSVSVTGDACQPDAGTPEPEMSTPTPTQPDAGAMNPPVMDPPIITPPVDDPDPCYAVMCAEGQFCNNGTCVNDIE